MGEVRLGLPAQPGFVQVARLTVTAVAARVGFSYDEIEDLRIAVGEVGNVLVAPGSEARLTVRVTASDRRITVDVVREPAGPPVEVGELSDQILRAVTDDVEVDADAGRITFTKQRQG